MPATCGTYHVSEPQLRAPDQVLPAEPQPQRIPEDIPDRMPEGMSEDIPDNSIYLIYICEEKSHQTECQNRGQIKMPDKEMLRKRRIV